MLKRRAMLPELLNQQTCSRLIDIHSRYSRRYSAFNGTYKAIEGWALARRATLEELAFVDGVRNHIRDALVASLSLRRIPRFQSTELVSVGAGAEFESHVDNADWDPRRARWVRSSFWFRSHTMIVYLADSGVTFRGGDLFFPDRFGRVQECIVPKAGLGVAFSSGPSNRHGTTPVESGRRFTLATWFCRSRRFGEPDALAAGQFPPPIGANVNVIPLDD